MKRILLVAFLITTIQLFAQQPCGDLFFSEYIEGTSFNKAIEIVNPTTLPIDLSTYQLNLYSNGSATPTSSFALSGLLAPNDVYVVANSQADPQILAQADATSGTVNFNGDDAFELYNGLGVYQVDVIGEIGVLPTGSWPVDTGSTANHTLVRKVGIQMGQMNWTIGATEWDAYGVNDFSHLGSHTFTSCNASTNPDIYFLQTTSNQNENAGTVSFAIGISNSNNASTSFDVTAIPGTAGASDYTFSPTTLTFAANAVSPINVSVGIVDDAITESTETFTLHISNATNGASVSIADLVVSIIDNDATTPTVSFHSIPSSYNENAGTFQLQVDIANANSNPTSVDLGLNAPTTTATPVQDFSFTAGTLTFPASSLTPLTSAVNIVDDNTFEGNEVMGFKLSNPTNGSTIGGSNTMDITIIDNDPNSVSNIFGNSFSYYPNPAHQLLNLVNAGTINSISISNLIGETVLNYVSNGQPTQKLNIRELLPGMYFMNVISNDGIRTYKLRVE